MFWRRKKTRDASFTEANGGEQGDLRLLADDKAGLEILSALLQDSIIPVGKIHFDKSGQTFIAQVSRLIPNSDSVQRIQSLLRIDNVLSTRSKGLRRSNAEALTVLLSLNYVPDEEPPGGILHLIFAGGGEIQLDLDTIELRLMDISRPYKANAKPEHGL